MLKSIGLTVSVGLLGLGSCSDAPARTEVSSETITEFENPYFSVEVTGSGPDIILMPGLASSRAVWDGTIDVLKDRYTLHAIQVNGFAGAPALGNAGNENILDDLADGIAAYSSELESSSVLVGHSLGGLVAMKTALEPDANLRQLIIVDVLPFFSVLMDPAANADSMAPVAAMMKATLISQPDDLFALRQSEALKDLVKGESDLNLALKWSVESDRAVMAQAMSEVLVTDLREQVANIAVPTLVIYARDSAIPNLEGIERFYETLYSRIPDHRLIAIDDAFHFVMLDQPDAFLAALQTALN
ncbi:MAG: alpha/beta hydrolase [Alphaproteobacteria bacterium]|nr:alpha/beta hydrolase [Alphaproteobacteria bacterium]